MNRVIEEVMWERTRQISPEGFSASHDDTYTSGELGQAAACYIYSSSGLRRRPHEPPVLWPWDKEWWKPTTARRDLIKAAALIVAEIERLDRKAAADE